MGEYRLVPSNDSIVVDGHICVQVRDDIYRVLDDYFVDVFDWGHDSKNKGLHAIIERTTNEDKTGYIRYVTIGERKYLTEFANNIGKNYKTNILVTSCFYTDELFIGLTPIRLL